MCPAPFPGLRAPLGVVGPESGAESAADDPRIELDEPGAVEVLLVTRLAELHVDTELLARLANRGLLGRLALLDAATGKR